MSPVQNRDEQKKNVDSATLCDAQKSIVNSLEKLVLETDDSSCDTLVKEINHPLGGCMDSNYEQPLESNYISQSTNVLAVQSGIGRSVREIARKFYSTTSSVYAEHTISNPNAEQILFCISTVLQAQIFEDLNAPSINKSAHPEFNHSSPLATEAGGNLEIQPPDIIARESENDDELRQQLLAGRVPTVETLFRYLVVLKEHARYPTECNIIALIYTNRITAMGSMALTMQNWRAVWVVSVILAQKMWDDLPLKTSSFACILPSFTKQVLRTLELQALNLIQFSSGVKPSLYAQYYFELRTLFSEIKGTDYAASSEWTAKPLSIIKARRLEDRSVNVWDKAKAKVVTSHSLTPGRATPRPFDSALGHGSSSKNSLRVDSKDRSNPSPTPSPLGGRKGWQTSSPSQAHAHARLQMIGLHEESKGKNMNPYVYDKRSRVCHPVWPLQEIFVSPASSPTMPSVAPLTVSSTPADDCLSGWVYSESQRGEEQVVRTFEDITLTDTSRFVLS